MKSVRPPDDTHQCPGKASGELYLNRIHRRTMGISNKINEIFNCLGLVQGLVLGRSQKKRTTIRKLNLDNYSRLTIGLRQCSSLNEERPKVTTGYPGLSPVDFCQERVLTIFKASL